MRSSGQASNISRRVRMPPAGRRSRGSSVPISLQRQNCGGYRQVLTATQQHHPNPSS
ncbi:MAG: hypothetical protein AAGB13_13365 [Cyanobacteria bacterium P01_F01_bin.33]